MTAQKIPERHGLSWTEDDYLTLLYWAPKTSTTVKSLALLLQRSYAGVEPKLIRFGWVPRSDGHRGLAFVEDHITDCARHQIDVLKATAAELMPDGRVLALKGRNHTGRLIDWSTGKATPYIKSQGLSGTVEWATARLEREHEAQGRLLTCDYSALESRVIANTGCFNTDSFRAFSAYRALSAHSYPETDHDLDPLHYLFTAFKRSSRNPPKKENTIMFSKPFNLMTRTTIEINGRNACGMSDSDIVTEIEKLEAQKKRLEALETKSTAVQAEIDKLQKGLVQIARFLDNRVEVVKTLSVDRDTLYPEQAAKAAPKLPEPLV